MKRTSYLCLLVLVGLAGATRPALGLEVFLRADTTTLTLPDGSLITAWGFGDVAAPAVSVPGPMLVVPPGEDLIVHLTNNLTEPVSFLVPGLPGALAPAFFVDAQGRQRASSLTHETAPGATEVYTFTSVPPGLFLYQSGTQPGLQVPMGLYGAVRKDASPTEAYPGLPVDNQAIVLLSEIDPKLQRAVADGTFGTVAYPSPIDFAPSFFFINGATAPAAAPLLDHPIVAGERVLVRIVNAGLSSHVPQVEGASVRLVAEDGKLAPAFREAFSVLVPAGQSADALFEPSTESSVPLFDRRLFLTDGSVTPGGMATRLDVAPAPAAIAPASATVSATSGPSGSLTAPPLGTVAPTSTRLVRLSTSTASLSSASQPMSSAAGARKAGALMIQRPAQTEHVSLAVPILLSGAPIATDDRLPVGRGATVLALLANDYDPDGVLDADAIVIVDGPRHGKLSRRADGALIYTPASNARARDAFRYALRDAAGLVSNVAYVRLDLERARETR